MSTIGKGDIYKQISEETGLSKKQVASVFDAYDNMCNIALLEGDSIKLPDVGIIKPTHRNERQGRNPKTGEAITIAAKAGAKLDLSKGFKEALN